MAGAPKGNKNSSLNNRLWAETIKRAVTQSDGKKLRAIADKLIERAADGDIQAIKEIGDRLDGKPVQSVDATVDQTLTVEIVKFAD
jgi:ribosomal protein L17